VGSHSIARSGACEGVSFGSQVEEWYCVEVDDVLVARPKAVLLRVASDEDEVLGAERSDEVWVPRSQLTNGSEDIDVGFCGEVCISLWFATERGWF